MKLLSMPLPLITMFNSTNFSSKWILSTIGGSIITLHKDVITQWPLMSCAMTIANHFQWVTRTNVADKRKVLVSRRKSVVWVVEILQVTLDSCQDNTATHSLTNYTRTVFRRQYSYKPFTLTKVVCIRWDVKTCVKMETRGDLRRQQQHQHQEGDTHIKFHQHTRSGQFVSQSFNPSYAEEASLPSSR